MAAHPDLGVRGKDALVLSRYPLKGRSRLRRTGEPDHFCCSGPYTTTGFTRHPAPVHPNLVTPHRLNPPRAFLVRPRLGADRSRESMRGQTLLGSRKVGWGERPITAAPALRRAADTLFPGRPRAQTCSDPTALASHGRMLGTAAPPGPSAKGRDLAPAPHSRAVSGGGPGAGASEQGPSGLHTQTRRPTAQGTRGDGWWGWQGPHTNLTTPLGGSRDG